MTFTDELRKALSDPKPLYFVAGAGDAAVSRLRESPNPLSGASDRLNRINDAAVNLMARAPERLAEMQARFDPKAVRETLSETDLGGLRERAQTVALGRLGRVLEAAGHAVETYEDLAERGKVVVDRFRGGAGDDDRAASDRAASERVTVVRVEQVTDDEATDTTTEHVVGTTSERPHATRRASTPRAATGTPGRRAGTARAHTGGTRGSAGAAGAEKAKTSGTRKAAADRSATEKSGTEKSAGRTRGTARRKPGTTDEPSA